METKEMKITPPSGYIIDKENSTFECIKFKPKPTISDYDAVAKELFKDRSGFYINSCGKIMESDYAKFGNEDYFDPNNCTSENQGKKLMAINKLMNVAKYLNKGWKPNWGDFNESKYTINYDTVDNKFCIVNSITLKDSFVYFKSKEVAKEAIKILGEDTIRLALSTDW